jgi:hypothetical protein
MIAGWRDKYRGAEIAVLGSGPTLHLFDQKEDLAIAVNGASGVAEDYDILLAGDVASPKRDWWLKSERLEDRTIVRIVSSYIAPFDPCLYPSEASRKVLQSKLEMFIKSREGQGIPYVNFVPDLPPEAPHGFFRFGGFGREFVERIGPDQEVMYWGGTISAIAVQFALIAGAAKINIYGCGFDNTSGLNYSYCCPQGQAGGINDSQREIMQATLDRVRSFGLEIKVVGKSNIR